MNLVDVKWFASVISELQKLRQEGCCELEASLGYTVSSKTIVAKVKPYWEMGAEIERKPLLPSYNLSPHNLDQTPFFLALISTTVLS